LIQHIKQRAYVQPFIDTAHKTRAYVQPFIDTAHKTRAYVQPFIDTSSDYYILIV